MMTPPRVIKDYDDETAGCAMLTIIVVAVIGACSVVCVIGAIFAGLAVFR